METKRIEVPASMREGRELFHRKGGIKGILGHTEGTLSSSDA